MSQLSAIIAAAVAKHSEVSERLDICTKSISTWKATYSKPAKKTTVGVDQNAEMRRLKAELLALYQSLKNFAAEPDLGFNLALLHRSTAARNTP